MLDTNTVSYFVKGRSKVDVRVVTAPAASLCISAITAGELLFGLALNPAATSTAGVVHQYLMRTEVFSWDFNAAWQYGSLKATLQQQGKLLGHLDTLIAAHAISVGAVLVTSDRAFQRVPDLQVEDWTH